VNGTAKRKRAGPGGQRPSYAASGALTNNPGYHRGMLPSPDAAPSESPFTPDHACALRLDVADALAGWRDQFHIPRRPDGTEVIYFCGNSLGLAPRGVADAVKQELEDWERLAVDAHFAGRTPWYSYHEQFRESGARLVGAVPGEVVYMNSLTVNLHLMMASFYRPTRERHRILIEDAAFPSDIYAARTQLRWHGFDPADGLLVARPRPGEHTLRSDDIEELLEREGPRIALVLFSGVNYYTGQVFDMARITQAAHRQGCVVGFDLAHAAGNVELRLHEWDVDFAAWCTYKYLNCGPGAVAGCFVHERHGRDVALRRFGGWWGNDPATRFRMHLEPEFVPVPGAEGWQLSNPPILSMAPLRVSLAMFDSAGLAALRAKSLRLTGYLQYLLDQIGGADSPAGRRYEVITPRDSAARGCQLSILVRHRPKELFERLQAGGIVCDYRVPDVIGVAPVPLYNAFHEVWRFADVLRRHA
jgi:kynureninase